MSIYYGEGPSRPRARLPAAIRHDTWPIGQSVRIKQATAQKTKSRTSGDSPLVLQETVLKEMATADDEEASYERALNFLTDNEPKRRFDIRLSYRSFQVLEEQAHALYRHSKIRRLGPSASACRHALCTVLSWQSLVMVPLLSQSQTQRTNWWI